MGDLPKRVSDELREQLIHLARVSGMHARGVSKTDFCFRAQARAAKEIARILRRPEKYTNLTGKEKYDVDCVLGIKLD